MCSRIIRAGLYLDERLYQAGRSSCFPQLLVAVAIFALSSQFEASQLSIVKLFPMSLLASLGLVALASASGHLLVRNNPPQPPCVYPYTKFVYSGCFVDSVSSRTLPFQTVLEFNNATVEQCTAYCKGNNYRYAGLEYFGKLP